MKYTLADILNLFSLFAKKKKRIRKKLFYKEFMLILIVNMTLGKNTVKLYRLTLFVITHCEKLHMKSVDEMQIKGCVNTYPIEISKIKILFK